MVFTSEYLIKDVKEVIKLDTCRISPPVLPIQFGIRNEHTSILRHGTFIQFESSQKMNGVFVAVLLREVRFCILE